MTLLINFVEIIKTPYFSSFLYNTLQSFANNNIYIYNSRRTSQSRSTQYVSIMKTNVLMLFASKIVFIVKVIRK